MSAGLKPSTAGINRKAASKPTYDFDVDSDEEKEEKQEFTRQLEPWEISRTGKLKLTLVSASLTEA